MCPRDENVHVSHRWKPVVRRDVMTTRVSRAPTSHQVHWTSHSPTDRPLEDVVSQDAFHQSLFTTSSVCPAAREPIRRQRVTPPTVDLIDSCQFGHLMQIILKFLSTTGCDVS
ncbi:hypothetical protein F2P81_024784 [Scophthalmus maximus]|uniref:Uncharacterized protein n=1 Tax=Scophthalmus maximus TaxID=52904 RepID=A0A6A4RLS6_SCOMX|nr:hypothetical protein F2P81_024784 [Scophthalmus maximus]